MISSQDELARLERLPFEVHPAANLFPMMSAAAFAELVEDIRQHGVKEMIVIWQGKLLDGRNRATALMELGLDPSNHACDIQGGEEFDPVAYVMSANLHRRHLTTGQRAMVAAEVANLEHGKNKDTSNDVSQNDAATLLSVSVPSVQRAKVVLGSGDDALITSVKTGELPVSKAAEIVKERSKPKPVEAQKHDRPGEHVETELFAKNKAEVAITQLKGIPKSNKYRDDALDRVLEWIEAQKPATKQQPQAGDKPVSKTDRQFVKAARAMFDGLYDFQRQEICELWSEWLLNPMQRHTTPKARKGQGGAE